MLFFAGFLLFSCKEKPKHDDTTQKNMQDLEKRISKYTFPSDSILMLLDARSRENDYASIAVLSKVMGQRMRDGSDFSKAISYHQQGLDAALVIQDTLMITQLLNHLGTDFRRIGAFPEASDYHFRALKLSETYSKKDDFTGRKNRVVAMNGIGNIYLSLNNPDEAEQYFRSALVVERELESALGQAINYANIGAVFQMKQQYDSALVYYSYSMQQNLLAGSKLGMGLCYNHFGEIYELQNDLGRAEKEFLLAYETMKDMQDKYHWLESCLALGRINLVKGDDVTAEKYINLAKKEALKINSSEHLAETYNLEHQLLEKQGDYRHSLEAYKLSIGYQDSVKNLSKINHALDTRVNYERGKSLQRIDELNQKNRMQAREKNLILIFASTFALLMFLFFAALAYAYIQRTKSNKALKNIDKMRSGFFTNVTHEFRTPLTIILGLSAQLKKHKSCASGELLSHLNAIQRQSDSLLQLVNRLLDMARMEAGISKPDWKQGNILAYVEMIIESYRLYASEKEIFLRLHSSELSIEMDFVPHYVDEIVRNLLSNAIKFSNAGTQIVLSISQRNKEVEMKVIDKGAGIPETDIEHIFEPFFQGSDSAKNVGTGIGLHYVKQLVENMHGRISVKSKVGEGATFTVILPLKQSEGSAFPVLKMDDFFDFRKQDKKQIGYQEPDLEEDDKTEQEDDAHKEVTILVVEDNKDIVAYIKSLIPPVYRVVSANNGNEGLNLANELIPDLIITDVMMPEKDGYGLCSEVKASELLNHIPVIMLTAKSTIEDQLKGLDCGADAYIRKPFHPEELLIRIEKLLESRKVLKKKYMRSVLKGETGVKDVNMDFLQRVTDLIYCEMHDPAFSSSALADKVCLSSSQLNRKLSAISGYSPTSYILHVRVNNAKKKLSSGDKPIGDIAAECGFYDMAYFSRTFKKYTGVTPSQYRRCPV